MVVEHSSFNHWRVIGRVIIENAFIVKGGGDIREAV